MRLSALAAVSATVLLASAVSAKADTFTFSANTSYGLTFSGTLTGSTPSGGSSNITSATGTVAYNSATTSLSLYGSGTGGSNATATSGSNTFTYDDIVYTSGTSVDQFGLLFSDGGDLTQIGFANGGYFFSNGSGGPYALSSFTLTDTTPTTPTNPSSVTPEPSSIALLGTGLLGIAGTLRRRFQA